MKIKLLKSHLIGNKDDVVSVTAERAKYLISCNVAEAYDEKTTQTPVKTPTPPKPRPSRAKAKPEAQTPAKTNDDEDFEL